jgi:sugar phosphate isomerase/epimerase
MGFRLGLCSVTFRSLAPADVIEAAVAAGVEGIEWGADVHVPPGEEAIAGDVRARCADANVTCPSYGSYLAAGKSSPERTPPVLATAATLGATNVRVWCPFGVPPGTDDDLFRRAADDLATWSAMAADLGLTVSTEFHVGTLTETAQSTRDLLDAAGRPDNLFTYWQPVEGRPLLDEAASIRSDVSHVHVFHWAPGGDRRPLAEGDHWQGLLDELARPARFDGGRFAFLEFVRDESTDQLVADAATLRGWLA